jgi:hypothetical protein
MDNENYLLLNQKFREFISFINFKTKKPFSIDFRSNPYIYKQEGYKEEIRREAFNILSFLDWETKHIGTGKILDLIIASIELNRNNLVKWQDRYGPETKKHQKLYEIKKSGIELKTFEMQAYKFFLDEIHDDDFFNYLISVLGKNYSLIAYFFFIKNSEKYLPISTKKFDDLFKDLKIPLITTMRCSWENYCSYLKIILDIRFFLSNTLNCDVTLLDAHSFCWILTSQMRDEQDKSYLNNISVLDRNKDKETIIKSRVGQGAYRQKLIERWGAKCSVSDYSNIDLLIASHIKPWKDCNNQEAIDPDNGLLLTPNVDSLFDKGLLTFNDDGSIVFSSRLNLVDIQEFGISNNLKLSDITPKLVEYLSYHKEYVFQK